MPFHYAEDIKGLRRNFRKGKLRDYESRIAQLRQVGKLITENESAIHEALYKDLRKPPTEADFGEIILSKIEVSTAINNLKKWMKPCRVSPNLANKTATCEIRQQPYGVTLVIGPWNFPFALVVVPLIGAIAAGNCAIIKPSEISEHTSQLLKELISNYLDPDCFKVICGGVPETTALLEEKFDHIFYTGSSLVGKIIMKAAAKHLTPVTLELGGKCPVIVDNTCDYDVVAKRVVWGKFVNCGQACLAVDYVLCVGDEVQEKLTEAMKKVIVQYFSEDAQKSDSYCRIINKRHFERLSKLIDKSKVAFGNKKDEDDLYISPTILNNVTATDAVMQEEIFGPILPLLEMETLDDAIDFILDRGEPPLSVYVFSNDYKKTERISNEVSSGGIVINDVFVHYLINTLPFGGIGNSGMGKYHGKFSFEAFSNEKAYVYKSQSLELLNAVRYPPYDEDSQLLRIGKWAITPNL